MMGANTSSLNKSSSRSVVDTVGINNLPPITFHYVHGENIRIFRNGAIAKRTDSFCKGIVFSNRPIKINEKVFIKFSETSTCWSGVLRFGFSSFDPSTLRNCLPRYACPDFTNKQGYWAKALAENYAEQGSVLFYYVSSNGDVYFGINGEEKGVFFSGVDVTLPLWAMLDIYGNTTAVELLDCRSQLNNSRPRQQTFSTSDGTEQIVQSMREVNLTPVVEISSSSFDCHPIFNPERLMESMSFHHIHGRNIKLSLNRLIAMRTDSEFSCGYVFSSRPLQTDQKFLIQVLATENSYVSSLTFGLTNCDPSTLTMRDLPEDSNLLLDRPEYWVVIKDVAQSPKVGEELGFSFDQEGKVFLYRKSSPPIVILHVDQTQTLWAFFDVYGHTLKIKSVGVHRGSMISSQGLYTAVDHQLRVALPPQNVVLPEDGTSHTASQVSKLPPLVESHMQQHVIAGLDGCDDNSSNECSVCYERPIDSVLYNCGHMCMCFQCSTQLWKKSTDSKCPICRAHIKDVIRTFRS